MDEGLAVVRDKKKKLILEKEYRGNKDKRQKDEEGNQILDDERKRPERRPEGEKQR